MGKLRQPFVNLETCIVYFRHGTHKNSLLCLYIFSDLKWPAEHFHAVSAGTFPFWVLDTIFPCQKDWETVSLGRLLPPSSSIYLSEIVFRFFKKKKSYFLPNVIRKCFYVILYVSYLFLLILEDLAWFSFFFIVMLFPV